MGKIITTVLALGAIGFLAYYTLYRPTKDQALGTDATSAPKQRLDNVRAKAKDIEQQQEQRAKDVEQRMNSEAGASGGVPDP